MEKTCCIPRHTIDGHANIPWCSGPIFHLNKHGPQLHGHGWPVYNYKPFYWWVFSDKNKRKVYILFLIFFFFLSWERKILHFEFSMLKTKVWLPLATTFKKKKKIKSLRTLLVYSFFLYYIYKVYKFELNLVCDIKLLRAHVNIEIMMCLPISNAFTLPFIILKGKKSFFRIRRKNVFLFCELQSYILMRSLSLSLSLFWRNDSFKVLTY